MSKERVPAAGSTPPESCGGSPGTILRRCREFHDITLEEASEATKIGISHLKALEEDQIREFANRAYLKGFLRIYATYLGLNSDDVARMYDRLFGIQSEKPDPAGAPSTPARPVRRLISFKKLLLPALLLAVILITATFFKLPPSPLVRPPQPAPAGVPSGLNAAVQTAQSSAQARRPGLHIPPEKAELPPPEAPETEKKLPEKHTADVSRGFILKIKVTQNGLLTATVDGSGSQRYELAVGDVIEWKAEKKVTLELSNAGGVDVELNGTPYKPFGPPGKPVYVELDADGVKQ